MTLAYRLMLLQASGDVVERYRGSLIYLLRMARQARTTRHRWANGRRWIELNVEPALSADWHRIGGTGHGYTRF